MYTLAFKPKFLRAVWFTLMMQSQQQGFQAPLTLISKGVVRKFLILKAIITIYRNVDFGFFFFKL